MATILTSIKSAVGIRDGKAVMPNRAEDLDEITDLFDRIAFAEGGTREIGGMWASERTALIAEVTTEIVRFQTVQKRPKVDGVIDPGGGTLKRMNELASEPRLKPLLTALPGDPGWEDWGHTDLLPLTHAKVPETMWEMAFGGAAAPRAMATRGYVCHGSLGTPHVGIGWPAGTVPSAYLLYFHHSIGQEGGDYASADTRFKKGIGDYMVGRMKGLDQIARSGKNVCLVVPEPTFFGQGVFASDDAAVTRVLKQIDGELNGGTERELPPLLVASYSDGLERLDQFMNRCKGLAGRVKAIYDFDGLLVTRLSGVDLGKWTGQGTRVFRYAGNSAPRPSANESKEAFLARWISRNPAIVPLPKERWVAHPLYASFKTNPVWAAAWWLHFYIPSCMLLHGLASTDGI